MENVLNRTIGKVACRDKIASINNLVMKDSPTIFNAFNRYSFVASETSQLCALKFPVLMLRCIDGLADPDALKECLYLLTLLQSVTS